MANDGNEHGAGDAGGNKVVLSVDGNYLAYWRGRIVFETESRKIRRFKSERDAREYLALCDALGKRA